MKNALKTALLLPFLLVSLAWSEPSTVGPISFRKGLEIDKLATLIDDEGSSDLCNCSPSLEGSMAKRNGSKRFITQAVSSQPVTSLYKAYVSTVNGSVISGMFATSGDKIYISTNEVRPQWVVISSNNVPGQRYDFVTMNGHVLIAGNKLTENTKKLNLASPSVLITSDAFDSNAVDGIIPRAKHHIVVNNYYIAANVQISTEHKHLPGITTYYASGIVYSMLNRFSSMTASRFIDFNQNDGEEITGIGSLTGGSTLPGGDFKTIVDFFKPSSIGELSFTILNLQSQSGDWVFSESVRGVGVLSPDTLVTTPRGYVFLDRSGVMVWDKRTFTNISLKIKPLIDEFIRSGNYKNASAAYYPKNDWYVLSIDNPKKFPRGRNNYILVFDFKTGEWWPFCNWLADSFTVADKNNDPGTLYYGDSNDGYVHEVDVKTKLDDSRREISIDVMDSSFSWVGSSHNIVEVTEGTASLKISIHSDTNGQLNPAIYSTSMTKVSIFQFGEWADKTRVKETDRLAFKAYAHNLSSITSLRVDFEMKNVTGTFDSNFSSVTISSSSLVNRSWTSIEVPLSSFPIRPDWTDLSIESVPFANRFNPYGIRFVISGVNISSISIDDLRIVGAGDNPNRMYRTSKLFDLNSPAFKSFVGLLVTMDKTPEASLNMDIYNDFGQKLRTEPFRSEVPKEIAVFRKDDIPGVSFLSSLDYSVIRETKTVDGHWDLRSGVMNAETLVGGDRTRSKLVSFNRADLSTFTRTYGGYGSAVSSFNVIHEVSEQDDGYLINDILNNRIKVHSKKNLGFLKTFGQLGNGATNFHVPSGGCGDNSNYYVSDEANNRVLKIDKSTGGVILERRVDHNTIADTSMVCGDKEIYLSYNRFSADLFDTTEVILESRDKGNLELIDREVIRPIGVSTGSYITSGSIGILGRYVFVPFTNDEGQTGPTYFIHKRLRDGLDLVSEFSYPGKFFGAIGYGLSWKPNTKTFPVGVKAEGRYIQFKFYDEDLDNYWRLYQMTPQVNVQPLSQP